MAVKTLDDLLAEGVTGRGVLVRSDLNVPLDDDRNISDPGRIIASVPTLKALSDAGAKVIVTAHLGRPKDGPDPKLSLGPVAKALGERLGRHVQLATDVVGPAALARAEALADGDVLLLENIRFDPRETSKDDAERLALAKALVELVGSPGAFVSDGFGVVHRKQASVYDVATLLPHYAGKLVAAEVKVLEQLTSSTDRPYAVVLGGSKVSDKLAVIENLATKADSLVIGGGMCFTFLASQGVSVGTSLLEEGMIDTCRKLLEDYGDVIHLPVDIVVAEKFVADSPPVRVPADQIPEGKMGLDIGPGSVKRFTNLLSNARTIFWNGPMGVFEFPAFAAGTKGVAEAIIGATAKGAFSVVGGGDSAAAVRQLGLPEDGFSHISTGGGASLEYLEGKTLPGIEVLDDGKALDMSRKALSAGNWKMNLNHFEAIALVQKIAFSLPDKYFDKVDVTVVPPFTDLRSVQTLVDGDKLRLTYGAQDLSQHDSGAYTGEISGAFLAKLGCTYAVVGHSERRTYHAEDDALVAAKAAAAFKHDLTPIICIGEQLEVREAGNHVEHNVESLRGSVAGLSAEQIGAAILAYEPVWALGTGRVASAADAQEVCKAIRDELGKLANPELAAGVRVLYGGSVNAKNVGEIVAQEDVDGALVGGASLDGEQFATLSAIAAGDRLPWLHSPFSPKRRLTGRVG